MTRVSRAPRLVLASIGVGKASESVPLGIACVAEAIAEAFGDKLALSLVEGGGEEARGYLAEKIGRLEPALVGLSVYSWNRKGMGELARGLRALGFAGALFAGGAEASADPFGVARDLGLDFVVVGEGELSAVEALRALGATAPGSGRDFGALAGLPGIALPGAEASFRRRSPPKPETLASPWLGGRISSGGREEVLWELSRGCAFSCTYCFEGRGEGGVRAFPRRRLEAELERFVAEGAKTVFVLDPTFNWKRERALELLSLFAAKGRNLRWKFEVRAELLDQSIARAFSRLDASLQIGLQSADPKVLARVGRPGFEASRFAEKVGLLDAEGVTWGLDLIYGLPGDTLSGFKRSLDYALGLAPNHLDVFRLSVLPGTRLAEEAEGFGLESEGEAPHRVLRSPTFPAEDLDAAETLARACDLFYSRGRAVSWFLRVLAPLRARPATFLERFAAWAKTRDRRGPEEEAHGSIERLQLDFLESEYRGRKLDDLVPLVLDLVRIEGAWTRAIAEGETTSLELSHEPSALLDSGIFELRDLARVVKPRHVRIKVRPGRRGPEISRSSSR